MRLYKFSDKELQELTDNLEITGNEVTFRLFVENYVPPIQYMMTSFLKLYHRYPLTWFRKPEGDTYGKIHTAMYQVYMSYNYNQVQRSLREVGIVISMKTIDALSRLLYDK